MVIFRKYLSMTIFDTSEEHDVLFSEKLLPAFSKAMTDFNPL